MEKSIGRANRWIVTAADEVRQIQKRWKFSSVRQFSKFLHMNPRTLSKLVHLDGSLKLESIAKIYTRLVRLRCLRFVDSEMKEEELRLLYSLFRIMSRVDDIPPSLTNSVLDELGQQ